MSQRIISPQTIDTLSISNLNNEIYNDGVDNYIKIKVNNTDYIIKLAPPTPTPTVTPTVTPTITPTITPTTTPTPSPTKP